MIWRKITDLADAQQAGSFAAIQNKQGGVIDAHPT
jgi:hypothetical protein